MLKVYQHLFAIELLESMPDLALTIDIVVSQIMGVNLNNFSFTLKIGRFSLLLQQQTVITTIDILLWKLQSVRGDVLDMLLSVGESAEMAE